MYGANDTTSCNILKLENIFNDYPSFYSDEHLLLGELWNQQQHQRQEQEICDINQMDKKSFVLGVSELNWPCNINSTQMTCLEFNDFEDFGLWEWEYQNNENLLLQNNNNIPIPIPIDVKPLNYKFGHDHFNLLPYHDNCNNNVQWINNNAVSTTEQEVMRSNKAKTSTCYNKSSSLSLDDIHKYFDVPITKAAKELNVGLTVLKKRCRELNIARWPHRKIKSLSSLIDNVKELGLKSELAMLEEHKRMLLDVPEMELTERTKKLRQAFFKANYKKRKIAHHASATL